MGLIFSGGPSPAESIDFFEEAESSVLGVGVSTYFPSPAPLFAVSTAPGDVAGVED